MDNNDKTQSELVFAENSNLRKIESNSEDYRLCIEIRKYDTLIGLNIVQGMVWDALIRDGIVKKYSSVKEKYKALDRQRKNGSHFKFAIRYGNKEALEKERDHIHEGDLFEYGHKLIKSSVRRIGIAQRKIQRMITRTQNDPTLTDWQRFQKSCNQLNILVAIYVEPDV